LDIDDTIAAIASPTTPAIRGIVRLSGPGVLGILQRLGLSVATRHGAHWLTADLDVGPPIGIVPTRVLVWPTARSYTGQPAAELHSFGSLPVLQALVEAATTAGARAARPGEFTMRAFLAGRLDLVQAEAVLGVIDAQQRGSLDHALRQLAGNLSRPLEQMRSEILDLLADVEAGLDFVDEDIEFISDELLIQRLKGISRQLDQTRKLVRQRGSETSNIVVTIRGEPNAGKSQLVNCLAGRHVAIVADVAGTTRDVVTIETNVGGHTVTLTDTAGIEQVSTTGANAEISRQSQTHAQRASDSAHIRVWCVDTSRADFQAAKAKVEQAARGDRRNALDIWVGTKVDQSAIKLPTTWLATSAVTGVGIDELRATIGQLIEQRDSEEIGSVIGTAARCRGSLQTAATAIATAIETTETQQGHEFVSAELRTAAQCLGEVTGAIYTDDILDRVFSRFCIGK
jgi:tRNA modification GTPase